MAMVGADAILHAPGKENSRRRCWPTRLGGPVLLGLVSAVGVPPPSSLWWPG